ncbi:MAG: hypothetical protein WDW36_004666 [Sanguina aurantia]
MSKRWSRVGLAAVRCAASSLQPTPPAHNLVAQASHLGTALSNSISTSSSLLLPSQSWLQHHHLGGSVLQPAGSRLIVDRLYSGGAFSQLEEHVARDKASLQEEGSIKQTEGGAGDSNGSTPSTNVDEVAPEGKGTEERSSAVKRALESGELGFGFSAGGFLFPYYLGILWQLSELGLLRGRVRMAGASAGSLAIATYNSGLTVQAATDALFSFAADCRAKGTHFRIGLLLEDFLHKYLPTDAHLLNKGVSYVALTKAFPYFQPELLTDFADKDDFVQALMTSCHIPWYANGGFVRKFRDKWYLDGGARNFLPVPPHTSVNVKICCFPVRELLARVGPQFTSMPRVANLVDVAISPDTFEPFEYRYRDMLQMALVPASDEILAEFIVKGRRDAQKWAERERLVPLADKLPQVKKTNPQEIKAEAARASSA